MVHLFLDLENTVITPVVDGWHNVELIPENIDKICSLRSLIREIDDQIEVHIFSFAIWHKNDLAKFDEHVRPMLQAAMDCRLHIVPTVNDDIIKSCSAVMNLSPENVGIIDLCDFWGKHEAFRLFVRKRFGKSWSSWGNETKVILIDDAVINEKFEWPDLYITGQIFNINTM